MRRHVGFLVGLLLPLAACSTPADERDRGSDGADGADAVSGGAASCVGPYVDARPPGGRYGAPPPTVAPGESVMLYGHWYTSTCNDQGQDDPLVPLDDVTLTVTLPDGTQLRSGPLTPHGDDLGFSTQVTVPAGTPPGPAQVRDGRAVLPEPYEFEVS